MRAAIQGRYGPAEILGLAEIPRPTPGADEVLVRVSASTVTSGDVRLRAFRGAGLFWLPMRLLFGVLRPRNPVPGMEFSGRVEQVGKHVTTFQTGEAVFGLTLRGANAEYLVIRANGLIAPRPAGLPDRMAAATPFGALSALAFLRDVARLEPGERILVRGATGAVGVFAIQMAVAIGADVTAVCSGRNAGLAQSLGARRVVDYQTEDFTATGETYDVILDTVGAAPIRRCRRMLRPGGRYVPVVIGMADLVWALVSAAQGDRHVRCAIPSNVPEDLADISAMVVTGRLRPVIDRVVTLDQIVEAHRHVDSGRKVGALVIDVQPGEEGSPLTQS